jgi:hypothetical protein
MTTLATITVTAPSPAFDKQHQEVQYIDRALQLAKADIRAAGGKKTSGNILSDGATVIGSWTYTPVASS